MKRNSITRLGLSVASTLLFVGCSSGKKSAPAPSAGEEVSYLVHVTTQKGEKPAQIAEWYLGSPKKWTDILAHNKQLEGKKKLDPDQIVLIPLADVTTLDPMPSKQTARSVQQRERPESQVQQPVALGPQSVAETGRVAAPDPFLDGADEGTAPLPEPIVSPESVESVPAEAVAVPPESVPAQPPQADGSSMPLDEQAEIDRIQQEIEEARLKASGRR